MMMQSAKLVVGNSYGRKAKDVYLQCCDLFGWDSGKASRFGMMQPLYAYKADRTRTKEVWFICSSNIRNPRYVNALVDGRWEQRLRNKLILNKDGNVISIEECQPTEPDPAGIYPLRDRIVFAQDKYGNYVFRGIFRAKEPNSRAHLREFYKIADEYSIN